MEKLYCTIYIVDISQNPEEEEAVTSRIQQLIEDHGGIIQRINRWGKKRLAYPIQKKTHGYYVEIEFTAKSVLNIPAILEQEYRVNDRVLRYLTYVVDKKELIQRAKKAGKKAEKEAPAAEKKETPAAPEAPVAEAPAAEPEAPQVTEPAEAENPPVAETEAPVTEEAQEAAQESEEKKEEK